MTSVLKHSENYPQMQSDVNTIIDTLNDHIYEINKLTNVSTPFLHSTIMEKGGQRNPGEEGTINTVMICYMTVAIPPTSCVIYGQSLSPKQ